MEERMRKKQHLFFLIIVLMVCFLGLAFCTSSSSEKDNTTTDTSIDPSSKICGYLPKCYNNKYPTFFGSSKKECIGKLEEMVSEDDIEILLDSLSDCNTVVNILSKYQYEKTCEIIKSCIGDSEFNSRFGSIEKCVSFGQTNNINEKDFICINENSANCPVVFNECLARFTSTDAGVEDTFIEDGGNNQKVCYTDTREYTCENFCDDFYECFNRWCPPPQEGCTRESCIYGCRNEFSMDLLCCGAELENFCEVVDKCSQFLP